jgi:hypothetical protein
LRLLKRQTVYHYRWLFTSGDFWQFWAFMAIAIAYNENEIHFHLAGTTASRQGPDAATTD